MTDLKIPLSLLPQTPNISPGAKIPLIQGGITEIADVQDFDNRYLNVINIASYGAVADDLTDNYPFIQAAINAAHQQGGGVVFIPVGTYRIKTALTLFSDITIQGVGMECSIIHQTTGGQDGFDGVGCSSICLYDFTILGNGTGSTPGTSNIGINLTYGTAGNNPFHNFKNLHVSNWGSDGIRIETPIVCSFDKVYSSYNGAHGFNWYEGGTSCNFKNCWARQNAEAGYRFNQSVYQALTGCAADNNGIGYLVQSAQSIAFVGCGAEGSLNNDGTYSGYGWEIFNSSVISIDACWITDNRNIGIWVTGGAQDVAIRAADNTPHAGAVFFIQVDANCIATIYELHNTTANSLAPNTTLTINDGSGAIAASGHLVLKAGANSVTKTSSVRQDVNANTYERGNTITQRGRGYIQIGAASNAFIDILFPIAFNAEPIVVPGYGGDSAASNAFDDAGNNIKGPVAVKAYNVSKTGCRIHIHSADGTAWSAGNYVFFTWIAEGEID